MMWHIFIALHGAIKMVNEILQILAALNEYQFLLLVTAVTVIDIFNHENKWVSHHNWIESVKTTFM